MMNSGKLFLQIMLLGLLFVVANPFVDVLAQDTEEEETSSEEEKKEKKEKGYSDYITEDAKSDEGLWVVHKVEDKYYFEIPRDLLEEEILVVSRISGYVKDLSFGGAGMKSRPQQVIRFQEQDDKLLIRSVSYNSVASFEDPIYESVRNNNFEPIIARLDIQTQNEDSTALVAEISKLFTTDVPMIGALSEGQRKRFKIKGLDKGRSFIQSMKSFPENVEIRHVLTYKGGNLPDNQLTQTLSIEMNQSFILLPEEPITPRLYDPRVGYFSIRQVDYGLDAHRAEDRRYITRWRMIPKDVEAYQNGELVEPIDPIVYYIDPATPKAWRPHIKQGVEDWQSAFEKIGFKNAIIAKDPPSKEEDPNWSPEDVRYSVIRYVATEIQNAMGPHVHDPRTGEILESDIIWYHNVMRLLRNWFFIQTAPVNPEARTTKFEDALMGELIRFVSAHEVGHTLGLPHNMGSSAAYPVDSLRAPGFVQRMGVAPSIMDYARFNYVAQPGDEGVGLYPKIGPYDDWSIRYGYKYISGAETPDDEKDTLNQWILERADNPIYSYGRQQGKVSDPRAQTEDLSDDAVEASNLGIKNLVFILDSLSTWTYEEGESYDQLKELYLQVIGQYRRYIGHVATHIGGVYDYPKKMGQEGSVYSHVPMEKQMDALDFLNKKVFISPSWLVRKEILNKIQNEGVLDQIRSAQSYALQTILDDERLKRLMENESINGGDAMSPDLVFETVERNIFSELESGAGIDPYRRNLQRTYVKLLGEIILDDDSDVHLSDTKAFARSSLERIAEKIDRRAKRIKDKASRSHLEDLQQRITVIFESELELKKS